MATVGRRLFGGRLYAGYHNANNRLSIWSVGGYPEEITFSELYRMYRRNGIANAVAKLIVDECWQSNPVITGGGAEFQEAIKWMEENIDLWSRMRGMDLRQRVGRYGGMVIVARERGQASSKDELKADGYKALVKLQPVYESQIEVSSWISDPSSVKYGDPEAYNYRSNVDGARNEGDNTDRTLHPSRVFAFGEDADDGSIYGVSAVEACYNSIMDMEKIRCGSAEGILRNSKQRFAVELKDDKGIAALKDKKLKDEFNQNMDDFNKGFDNSLLLYGAEARSMQAQLSSPKDAFDMCMAEIAAAAKAPATIIIGQQTGRLASDEDQKQLAKNVRVRRCQVINQAIRGLFRHLIAVGLLPEPTESWDIEWESTLYIDDAAKLGMAKTMSETNEISLRAGVGKLYSVKEVREAGGYMQAIDDKEQDEADESM